MELKKSYLEKLKQMPDFKTQNSRVLILKAIFFAAYWDPSILNAEQINVRVNGSDSKVFFDWFFKVYKAPEKIIQDY